MNRNTKIAAGLTAAAVLGLGGHTAYSWHERNEQTSATSSNQTQGVPTAMPQVPQPSASDAVPQLVPPDPTPSGAPYTPAPLPKAATQTGAMCWATFPIPDTGGDDYLVFGGTTTNPGWVERGTTWVPMAKDKLVDRVSAPGGTWVVAAQTCDDDQDSVHIQLTQPDKNSIFHEPLPVTIQEEDWDAVAPKDNSILLTDMGSGLASRKRFFLPHGVSGADASQEYMTWGTGGCGEAEGSIQQWTDPNGLTHTMKDWGKMWKFGSTVTFPDGATMVLQSCDPKHPRSR